MRRHGEEHAQVAADSYFEFSPTDRAMAILDRTSSVRFAMILDLEGLVDAEALDFAWQAVARRHPILRCALDSSGAQERWRPGGALAPLHGSKRHATSGAFGKPVPDLAVDPLQGPLVRLSVTEGASPRLVLAGHHAALDGRAAFLLLEDLRGFYLDVLAGRQPSFVPDVAPRTVRDCLGGSGLPVATRERIVTRSLRRWRRLPPSTHLDPGAEAPGSSGDHYAVIEIGPILEALTEQRRRHGWPLDAVLIGLLAASWTKVFADASETVSGWLLTTDLRPGLGASRGIGNLSGTEPVVIRAPGAHISNVIADAAAGISALRSSWPGLAQELLATAYRWVPGGILEAGVDLSLRAGRRLRYTRVLSNFGRLAPSLTDWGTAQVTDVIVIPPLASPPYVVFVAVGHGTSTSLCVRVSDAWLTADQVRQLEAALYHLTGVSREAVSPG